MSEEKKETEEKTEGLIDEVYKKFTRSVLRALSSDSFYEYFMDAVSRANNVFQFSNRKLEKTVDPTWVDMIESSLAPMEKIISSPRSVIKEEELIVNVASAKKIDSNVVRHIAQHASLVEKYDEETGDVRPSRVQQKFREESAEIYENRVVYTVMEQAYYFVKIRHDAIFAEMNDEFGAKLQVYSDMQTSIENVQMDLFMHVKAIDSSLETEDKNEEIFSRISRLYRLLSGFMNTPYALQLSKFNRVSGNLIKTNVLKKNPDYRNMAKLYDFLRSYDDIGYSIRVIEQNPKIDEEFQRNIFHNILFNYLILKGYLEDEKDRINPAEINGKNRKRTLKPKFIKEIIEELTEDYDLPDVEVRKVLIEELTREQLMKEEEAERLRLIEEREERLAEEARKAEEERLKKEAEENRLKKLEEERRRLEKEAEEERIRQEEMVRLAEDKLRSGLFKKELKLFKDGFESKLEKRAELENKEQYEILDFADAALIVEELEENKKRELAEKQRRLREEKEEALRRERAEREFARRVELERIEKETLERMEREKAEAERQRQADLILLSNYVEELRYFESNIGSRLDARRRQDAYYEQSLNQLKANNRKRSEISKAGIVR